MIRTLTILSAAAFLTATAVSAADMPIKNPPRQAPPPAALTYDWTGFYLGAEGGYGKQRGGVDHSNAGFFSTLFPADTGQTLSGFQGGALAGVRRQFGGVVLGAEADFQWLNRKASTSQGAAIAGFSTATSTQASVDQVWTARGVVGFPLGAFGMPNVMPYITGGYAGGWTNLSTSSTQAPGCGIGCGSAADSSYKSGWTLGAGVEAAVSRNLSVRAEYRHTDLGSTTVGYKGTGGGIGPTFSATNRFVDDAVLAGLVWRPY